MVLSSNFIIGIEARNINGKVVDSKTKEPLIGANVLIVGTTKGAATDVVENSLFKIYLKMYLI